MRRWLGILALSAFCTIAVRANEVEIVGETPVLIRIGTVLTDIIQSGRKTIRLCGRYNNVRECTGPRHGEEAWTLSY